MEDVLKALVESGPGFGLAAILLGLLGYLSAYTIKDRRENREALSATHDNYDSILSALRHQVETLQERVAGLERQLEDERDRRWQAEELARERKTFNEGAG